MTTATDTTGAGVVMGGPAILLRAEGAALWAVATLVYAQTGQPWWVYAVLFFLPDVAMLGYLRGPQVGAVLYNAAHATLLPWAAAVAGWAFDMPWLAGAGLVWLAHIGFDRIAAYGLKYGDAFRHTHLSRR